MCVKSVRSCEQMISSGMRRLSDASGKSNQSKFLFFDISHTVQIFIFFITGILPLSVGVCVNIVFSILDSSNSAKYSITKKYLILNKSVVELIYLAISLYSLFNFRNSKIATNRTIIIITKPL